MQLLLIVICIAAFHDLRANSKDNGSGKIANAASKIVSRFTPKNKASSYSYIAELNNGSDGQCKAPPRCENSRYRSIDGSCNNLNHPEWGMTGTKLARMLPAHYSDGVHAPRLSVSGKALPPARILSRVLFPTSHVDDDTFTLAYAQWGQIIGHDMSLIIDTAFGPSGQTCCNGTSLLNATSKGEPCYTLFVEKDDPMYKKYMDKSLSGISHWLDGSDVYGDTDATAIKLRARVGGKLKMEVRNGGQWPPTNFNDNTGCTYGGNTLSRCYSAGDSRINQNLQLAVGEVLLIREHNRLAEALATLNPHWDDERIFQEARKIVIGLIQHITYSQWLVGSFYSNDSSVNERNAAYNPDLDPSVFNEHGEAAMRFLHTNIKGILPLMSEKRETTGTVNIPHNMNDVAILETGIFDELARGIATHAADKTDALTDYWMMENLFRKPSQPEFGFDLKSLDIQRDRDHGHAPYNDYRELCGAKRAKTFEDFTDTFSPEIVGKMKMLYEHPDDVDVSVGGGLEMSYHVLGLMFKCITFKQFRRTRAADRFFYDRLDHDGAFTPDQLTEVKKSNIGRIICDNANVTTIQKNPFEQISEDNALVPCDSLPKIDLNEWKESQAKPFQT